MIRIKTKTHCLRVMTTIFVVTSFLGCIAAVPLVVKYAKGDKGYVSKVEVPAPADKVFYTAIRETEARPNLKILKQDNAERFIEITDGVQKASVKAAPVGAEKTELEVIANVPKTEEGKEIKIEREKEISLRIVNVICDGLGVKCSVMEK